VSRPASRIEVFVGRRDERDPTLRYLINTCGVKERMISLRLK
jgi:hypothetical protein